MCRIKRILIMIMVGLQVAQLGVYGVYNSSVTMVVEGSSGGDSSGGSSSGGSTIIIDVGYPMGGYDKNNDSIKTNSKEIKPNGVNILEGYIEGYPGNVFKPMNGLTREEYATIIYRILKFSGKDKDVKFDDVESSRWSYKAVSTLATYGILVGIGNNLYKPTREITVEESIIILDRLLYTDKYSKDARGIDIIGSDEGTDAIGRLYNMGVLDSIVNNGRIDGKRVITRWEIVDIINNIIYSDLMTMKVNKFNDIKSSDSYYSDIVKATVDELKFGLRNKISKIEYIEDIGSLPLIIY